MIYVRACSSLADRNIPMGVGHMVRSDLIAYLGEEYPDLTGAEVEKAVEIFFSSIIGRLNEGGRVELRGFGAFSIRAYDARIGRNPRTGEMVSAPAKNRAYFRPGKTMLERIKIAG